jgi:hypothetical protein
MTDRVVTLIEASHAQVIGLLYGYLKENKLQRCFLPHSDMHS